MTLVLIGGITCWRLLMAWLVPVTQDEAYYFDWARSLAWGYFDHPPGVALLGVGNRFLQGSAFAARLGGVVAGTLTLLVLARLYRNSGLGQGPDLWLGLFTLSATLPGLAGGFLTTPDTALALAWALALHESERALSGARGRWLTAGLAVGLGLLSKYSMLIIGPVLLWAILRADPRALRTPWPYLGALLALLVFAPNLVWNAQNDWLSLRLQVGQGFSTESGTLVAVAGVPAQGAGTSIAHSGPQGLTERLASLLAYLAVQLGLWGLMALPLLGLSRLARRGLPEGGVAVLTPAARALLHSATWIPLGFFALISLRSDVEANWPSMYLLAAPALLAPVWRSMRLWVLAAAFGNLLLVSLYGIHAATLAMPLPDALNRVLRETRGFRELAEITQGLDEPVYATRYQDTAMLRFYAPGIGATQWPALSRPSEYLRGQIAPRVAPEAIHGPFWLLSRGRRPPEVPGFGATSHRTLIDCPGQPLVESDTPLCANPLHFWSLTQYQAKSP